MRFLAALFACFCLIAPASAAPDFPALTGRVVDDAHILSDATRAALDAKLAALDSATSRQLVVVTVPSLGGYEISDYGYQLGRAWGIGQKKLNNGVLFIIAPAEHKARIEVGYGLEPILTDALSSLILQQQVLPRFRDKDYDGGVTAGTDALIRQLSLGRSAAEAKAAAAENAAQSQGQGSPLSALIIFLIIAFVFFRLFGGWGFLPFLFMGGGRGGGFGGGGGWGGGGFSGGGGSFGGGGASGSW